MLTNVGDGRRWLDFEEGRPAVELGAAKSSATGEEKEGDSRNRGDGGASGVWRRRIRLQAAAGLRWFSGNGKASYERGSARRSSGRRRLAPGTLLAGKSASRPAARLAVPAAAVLHEEISGAGQKRVVKGLRQVLGLRFYRVRRGRARAMAGHWPSMPWRASVLIVDKRV
jgi:hypothetical protein